MRSRIAQLEPLISESFQLNYIKASDLQNLITTNRQQQFGAGAGQDSDHGRAGDRSCRSAAWRWSTRGRTSCSCRTPHPYSRKYARSSARSTSRSVRCADRGAHRHRTGQLQPATRCSFRSANVGFTFGNKRYAGGSSGSLSTQPVVSCNGGTCTRETRTQTPFELGSPVLPRPAIPTPPQLNVNLPVPNPAGQLALTLINLGSGNIINLELFGPGRQTRAAR